ncbi:unnamed protein product [Linum tenue]|nr:unnamed protein product [Linum tenue]
MAVGEGGHKPCVQTFAADQFDEEKPKEKAAKSSFFNWWYLGIVFGASAAVLLVIYIQVSFIPPLSSFFPLLNIFNYFFPFMENWKLLLEIFIVISYKLLSAEN